MIIWHLKQELGRRPKYIGIAFKGWIRFFVFTNRNLILILVFYYGQGNYPKVKWRVFRRYEPWMVEVEKTDMGKSYKMVVLKVMLDRGVNHWFEPITPTEAALGFHKFLMEEEYRKNTDLSDKSGKQLWKYNEAKISSLISRMPMT